MSIEHAVLIESPDELETLESGVNRVYFGSEFCHRLLPSFGDIEACARLAEKHRVECTLLTPFVTDDELEAVTRVLDAFARLVPDGEVVFSDWGVLRMLRERYQSLTPVCGRLLNKQTIDPRIEPIIEEFPVESRRHFLSAAADTPPVASFLQSMGVNRIEFDNTFQGFMRQGRMPASLHYPYVLFSVTRLCPAANQGAGRGFRGIGPCRLECRSRQWKVVWKGLPLQAVAYGKAHLIPNYRYPPNLASLGIDRIVNHAGSC